MPCCHALLSARPPLRLRETVRDDREREAAATLGGHLICQRPTRHQTTLTPQSSARIARKRDDEPEQCHEGHAALAYSDILNWCVKEHLLTRAIAR